MVAQVRKIPNITCRKAKMNKEDVTALLKLSYEFFKESIPAPDEDFDGEFVAKQILKFINLCDSEILMVNNGELAIGMAVVYTGPAYYNQSKKVVDAHGLYIKKEYRDTSATRVLLTAIREWAKNKKLPWIRMIATSDKMRIKTYKGGD